MKKLIFALYIFLVLTNKNQAMIEQKEKQNSQQKEEQKEQNRKKNRTEKRTEQKKEKRTEQKKEQNRKKKKERRSLYSIESNIEKNRYTSYVMNMENKKIEQVLIRRGQQARHRDDTGLKILCCCFFSFIGSIVGTILYIRFK